jgi:hypothetical protein
MSPSDIIRQYFETFFSGPARHSAVRDWLTDDFTFRDPLMSADSADEYVQQVTAYGDEMDMQVEVRQIINQGDIVAALVTFQSPAGPITYAQWFTLRAGKIARLEVVYDPRPFLKS